MTDGKDTIPIKRTRLFIALLIATFAGIWGYLRPGSWAESTQTTILGVNFQAQVLFLTLLIISVFFVLFGMMKSWKIEITSNLTIRSREIIIVGSIICLLSSFAFNGLDILGFFFYYYELSIITLYRLFSLSYLPTITFIVTGALFLVIGGGLHQKKANIIFSRITLKEKHTSNYLIAGIVMIALGITTSTLVQFEYVTVFGDAEFDGIYKTIIDLPWSESLLKHFTDFYLYNVIFLYPLIVFSCGVYFLKTAVKIPAERILSVSFEDSLSKAPSLIAEQVFRLIKLLFLLIIASFVVAGTGWFLNIEAILGTSSWIFITSVNLLLLTFLVIFLVYLPKIIKPFLDDRVINYSARRLLIMIPMFVGISLISYSLMLTTGNPVDFIMSGYTGRNPDIVRAMLTQKYGLNALPQAQWFNWFSHLALGDLGNSIMNGVAVMKSVSLRIGPTLEIAIIPLLLALAISIPLGITAAMKQYSLTDNLISFFVSLGLSIPIFLVIILLIVFFSYMIPLLPPGGYDLAWQNAQGSTLIYVAIYKDTFIQNLFAWETWDRIFHLLLPIFAITGVSLALYTRLVRSGLLEILQQDYILSSMAYGFSERTIIYKHALRNVLIPLVTFIGLSLGGLLGGAPLTETTLSWPGLGRFGVQMILQYDYPVVMGLIMITAALILIANLITDLVYSVVDPRVSL